MNACSNFTCGWNGNWCSSAACPNRINRANQQPPFTLQSAPSPRTMPVNIPFSTVGVTIVTMDVQGNVTIKVEQLPPVDAAALRNISISVMGNCGVIHKRFEEWQKCKACEGGPR